MSSTSKQDAEYIQLSLFPDYLGKESAASFGPPDPINIRCGPKRGVVRAAYNHKKKWRFKPGTDELLE